jgi:peroxiredoxin
VDILEREIADADALVALTKNIKEEAYPDINLDDMYKKMHRLSELDGKVVLLYFWSAEHVLCNNINAELKDIYKKYHDKGFEVYHVSADTNRALWIEAVRAQEHPWISVFGGSDPRVFALYSVMEVPMAYIISRDGTMSVCSLERAKLESEIMKRL